MVKERNIGQEVADFADAANWPTKSTTNSGEKRGELWISLWGGLPVLEVTTTPDWETGGDWGDNPGERRMVLPRGLPPELEYPLLCLLSKEVVSSKMRILVKDIGKYSRRMYQFKI